jgi:DNA-binding XRE family transcriptional regulator
MTLEDVLRRYYQEHNVTQPELADALEVSQTTIHNWLSGKSKIPIRHYFRVCRLCEARIKDFIPGEWASTLD